MPSLGHSFKNLLKAFSKITEASSHWLIMCAGYWKFSAHVSWDIVINKLYLLPRQSAIPSSPHFPLKDMYPYKSLWSPERVEVSVCIQLFSAEKGYSLYLLWIMCSPTTLGVLAHWLG